MVRNRILAVASSCMFACGLLLAGGAHAEAIDYAAVFKKDVLKCMHPTVNVDKATVEISKPAEMAGEITTVRIKAFYDGLIKKNSLEADLMIRQSGSIRQIKVKPLSDTGTGMGSCDLEKNWKDF